MPQPVSARSRSASTTSSGVSPIPTMTFDFVTCPGRRRFAKRSTPTVRAEPRARRGPLPGRGAGLRGHHAAEAAPARAPVAEDQEGRLAFLPALADVRAHRLLAHGVETVLADEALHVPVVRAGRQPDLQSRRPAAVGGGDAGGADDRRGGA